MDLHSSRRINPDTCRLLVFLMPSLLCLIIAVNNVDSIEFGEIFANEDENYVINNEIQSDVNRPSNSEPSAKNLTLKCYCDICPNTTCVTDGLCLAEVAMFKGTITKRYRCLHDHKLVAADALQCNEHLDYSPINSNVRLKSAKRSERPPRASIDTSENGKNYIQMSPDFPYPDKLPNITQTHAFDDASHMNKTMLIERTTFQPITKKVSNPQKDLVTKCCRGQDFCNRHILDEYIGVFSYSDSAYYYFIIGSILMAVVFTSTTVCAMLKRKKIQDIEMKNKDLENKISKQDGNSVSSRAPLLTFDGTQTMRHHPNIIMKFTKNVPVNPQVNKEFPAKKKSRLAKVMNKIVAWSTNRPEGSGSPDPSSGGPNQVLDDESGSGKGAADLMPSSIAREIKLGPRIGSGRYGTVHMGEWRKQKVAVKVFFSHDISSCEREAELYKTNMLRHDNILGYIANDTKDNGFYTEFWLITEYHCKGSLGDYLYKRTMTLSQMMRIVYGILNGLQHLHLEIIGSISSKPSIAHRDIKPRNILVKKDGTVCIGDLGLACRYSSRDGICELPITHRQGTKRYMAPEILDNTINTQSFEALKAADMWAFGLVLWEILRRTRCDYPPNYDGDTLVDKAVQFRPRSRSSKSTTNSTKKSLAERYETPFKKYLQDDDHDFTAFIKIICYDEIRPSIPRRWSTDPILSRLTHVIKQCWYSPSARPCAFRLKKFIVDLNQETIKARLNPGESFNEIDSDSDVSSCSYTTSGSDDDGDGVGNNNSNNNNINK